MKHRGNLDLPDAHTFGGSLLSQAHTPHRLGDLNDQARFDFELVGVRQAHVGKYIATAEFDFIAVDDARFHLALPFQSSHAIFTEA